MKYKNDCMNKHFNKYEYHDIDHERIPQPTDFQIDEGTIDHHTAKN